MIVHNYVVHSSCVFVYIHAYMHSLLILYIRKSIYKGVPNFIHFNLALALLIGLIIFVSAIETVKENKVIQLIST